MPSLGFTATDATAVVFRCRVLGIGFPPGFTPLPPDVVASCTSPFSTGPLPDGNFAFEVEATDAAGNVGTDSILFWFTVDAG
jgi:hypothetical protein